MLDGIEAEIHVTFGPLQMVLVQQFYAENLIKSSLAEPGKIREWQKMLSLADDDPETELVDGGDFNRGSGRVTSREFYLAAPSPPAAIHSTALGKTPSFAQRGLRLQPDFCLPVRTIDVDMRPSFFSCEEEKAVLPPHEYCQAHYEILLRPVIDINRPPAALRMRRTRRYARVVRMTTMRIAYFGIVSILLAVVPAPPEQRKSGGT